MAEKPALAQAIAQVTKTANTAPGTSIVALLLSLLPIILNAVTPGIKALLNDALLDLYKKAKESATPVDEIFVAMLLGILGITPPTAP